MQNGQLDLRKTPSHVDGDVANCNCKFPHCRIGWRVACVKMPMSTWQLGHMPRVKRLVLFKEILKHPRRHASPACARQVASGLAPPRQRAQAARRCTPHFVERRILRRSPTHTLPCGVRTSRDSV